MEVKMLLLNMLLLFQVKISLKHDKMDLPCTIDNPCIARANISRRSQQQGACYGCESFQHWRSQCRFNPRPAMRNKTEFVKDKYSLITKDIDTKIRTFY